MEINGVPAHPLVVHAAVVFVPMAASFVGAYAVPRLRWATRWPAAVTVVLAAVSVQLSAMTGGQLKEKLGENPLIETHEMWAGRLQAGTWVLAGATLVAFWVFPHVTRLAGSSNREARLGVLEKPLMVLLPVLSIIVLVLVVVTGDAGARAVWAS